MLKFFLNHFLIYSSKMLKKMIPAPVLKATLEDMSIDWRDDEHFDECQNGAIDNIGEIFKEEGTNGSEAYVGSLLFKTGKNCASSLYYIDYTKIKGMSSAEKCRLHERVEKTKEEHKYMTSALKHTTSQINQLLMEPTNDELEDRLSGLEEAVVILATKVDDAQVLAINESQKKILKRRIQSMAGHYRKRKHICSTFLSTLEEVSDGSISKKKCLLGEGQIALDSDESAHKAAIALSKSKKRLKTNKTLLADDNFVGVALDSQNMLKRIYL
mmetsp:Transcript_14820/g.34417  ORF Transcript_14820/g.34417 Transcript_14820/m.34417 type:complete len:271 (-) Transcript_14820:274-1086(-)